MEQYLDIRINVFDQTGQHAQVLSSLLVEDLIKEIQQEFEHAGSPEDYSLYAQGKEEPLNPRATLAELNIQPWDVLIFDHKHSTLKWSLGAGERYRLREVSTGAVYRIDFQPALIGRSTNKYEHNLRLGVDLKNHPLGATVSREHAKLTLKNGQPFIQRLSATNPIFVNGKEISGDAPVGLHHKDRVQIGQKRITLVVEQGPESSPPPLNETPTRAPEAPAKAPVMPSRPAERSARPADPLPPPVDPPTRQLDPPSLSPASSAAADNRTAFYAPVSPPKTAPLKPVSQPEEKTAAARLVPLNSVFQASSRHQPVEIKLLPFELGRGLFNLDSSSFVSRRHAAIKFDERAGVYKILRLSATNELFLNGKNVREDAWVDLPDGAIIGLGPQFMLRFEILLKGERTWV